MFTIPIELPSGKKIRVPELKNKQYFNILKYCTNNDIEGLSLYFKSLLFDEYKIQNDLNFIDIVYTIIYIRMVFINPKIFIQNEDNKEISLNLSDFLNQIENLEPINNVTYEVDGITFEIGLPREFYFKNIDDILISTLKSITIKNNKINFTQLTKEEQNIILEKLPAKVCTKIQEFVNNLDLKLGSILLIEGNKSFNINELKIDIFSNQFLYFIQSIYTQDLKNFFELMYHYMNKVVHDASMFMELSPVDSNIILNFFKQETKEKNEELKKQQY